MIFLPANKASSVSLLRFRPVFDRISSARQYTAEWGVFDINFTLVIFVAEIIGTVSFAVSGVITAIEKKLDLFGSIVLGTTTAVGGGILRDVILGNFPPIMFRRSIYALVAASVSLLVFLIAYFVGKKLEPHLQTYLQIINVFDAIGLAIFVMVGMETALNSTHQNNAFLVVFVGTMTGVGGGILRDMMVGKIPDVLRKRIYALAAILGAIVFYLLYRYSPLSNTICMFSGMGVIILIRTLATIFKWNLPRISMPENDKKSPPSEEEPIC